MKIKIKISKISKIHATTNEIENEKIVKEN